MKPKTHFFLSLDILPSPVLQRFDPVPTEDYSWNDWQHWTECRGHWIRTSFTAIHTLPSNCK